jgi:hypothetical protein
MRNRGSDQADADQREAIEQARARHIARAVREGLTSINASAPEIRRAR